MRKVNARVGTNSDNSPKYQQVGVLIEKNGREMIKLDVIPVDFNGWLYVSKPKKPTYNKQLEAARAIIEDDMEDY